jgi:hypothetical protein
MPAAVYVAELPPVLLARGRGDDVHQLIRHDVRRAQDAPQEIAHRVIRSQKRLHCTVDRIRTKWECESARAVDT